MERVNELGQVVSVTRLQHKTAQVESCTAGPVQAPIQRFPKLRAMLSKSQALQQLIATPGEGPGLTLVNLLFYSAYFQPFAQRQNKEPTEVSHFTAEVMISHKLINQLEY